MFLIKEGKYYCQGSNNIPFKSTNHLYCNLPDVLTTQYESLKFLTTLTFLIRFGRYPFIFVNNNNNKNE